MKKQEFNKLIGQRLRQVRIEKGMTQKEISEQMEIESQNYSKYERGLLAPTFFWIYRFCIATKTELPELVKDLPIETFGNLTK